MLERRDRRRARNAPPPDTREIRILLLHANGMGGTIRTVFNLAGHLAKNHDVEIVSVVRESPQPFFDVPPGVRVRYLDDRVNGRKGLLNRFRSRLTPPDETAYHWLTLKTDLALLRYIRGRRRGVLIGYDGLLVPPEKIHALANAITTLITDPDLRTKLATQAQTTAAQYNMSVIGPRWDKLLTQLSRSHPAESP